MKPIGAEVVTWQYLSTVDLNEETVIPCNQCIEETLVTGMHVLSNNKKLVELAVQPPGDCKAGITPVFDFRLPEIETI